MQLNIVKSLAIIWLLGIAACAQGTITTLSNVDRTQSRLAVSKSVATADGSDAVTIMATIKDNTGSPVPNASVTFYATGKNNQLTPIGTATDGNGNISATLSSTHAEIKTLNANVTRGGMTVSLIDAPQVAFQAGPATQLVFSVQPTNAVAYGGFSPAVEVTAQDVQGNIATAFTEGVTLSLSGGNANAKLGGALTRSPISGTASFSGISVSATGTGYQLTAAAQGVVSSTSNTFDVGAPQGVLVFTQEPTNIVAGVTFAPAITVSLQDERGDTLSDVVGSVTLTLGNNPNTASLSGTTTQALASGVATFSGISITTAGSGYTLQASGANAANANSAAFNVAAGPICANNTTLAATPPTLVVNQNTTLTLMLADSYGNAVQGQAVTFTGDGAQDAVGTAVTTTDVRGEASTSYTSTKAAVHTFTAAFATTTLTSNITFVGGNPNASASTMVVNPNTFTTDQNAQITVQLVDDFNNQLSGQSVTFGSSGAGFSYASNPLQSDAAGQAQTLYFGTKVGAYTLNANVAGFVLRASANVLVGNPNGTLSGVVATPSTLGADDVASTNVVLTLVDSFNNPIPGVSPTWSFSGTRNTFTPSGNPTDAAGNSNGALMSSHAEAKTITATAGGTAVTGAVTFVPAAYAGTSTFMVNPTSVPADAKTTMSLDVLVADGDGNPLANQNVTFTADGRGDVLNPNAGITDSNGKFSATLTSEYAGNQNIIATFANVALTQQANFTIPVCSGTLLLPSAPLSLSGSPTETNNALGDFNNDGLADVIAVLPTSQVEVSLGNGKGGFSKPVTTSVPHVPVDVDVGEFTGDDKLDAIVTDTQGFQILQGKGDGSFKNLGAVAQNPNVSPVQLIDLNGDMQLDLVGLDAANGNVVVNLRLASTPGPLAAYPCTSLSTDSSAWMTAVDFDHDGHVDVLVANKSGGVNANGYLAFLKGNGDGTFQPYQEVDIDVQSSTPSWVLNANFNNDKNIDIAVVELDQVEVMLGHGDGTFSSAGTKTLSSIGLPSVAAEGDINNDGWTDLMVGGQYGEYIRFFGEGDGTLHDVGNIEAIVGPRRVYLLDLNADGYDDLLSGGDFGVGARLGRGDGTFVAPLQTLSVGLVGVAVADLDGDGDVDVVGQNGGAIIAFSNDGNGELTQTGLNRNGAYAGIELGDLNGDGKTDYASVANASVLTALGDGVGGFGAEYATSAQAALSDLQVGDLNGDGLADVAAVSTNANALYVFISNGDGSLQTPVSYNGNQLATLAIGDVTGDGALDIVATGATELGVYVNQRGSAAPMVPGSTLYSLAYKASDLVIADVNNDGRGDVVASLEAGSALWLGHGNVDGTLTVQAQVPAYTPYRVRVGDMNGDGRLDLVAGGLGAQIMFQKFDGTFTSVAMWAASWASTRPRLADMNGDGRLDYVVADLTQSYPGSGVLVALSSGCQ